MIDVMNCVQLNIRKGLKTKISTLPSLLNLDKNHILFLQEIGINSKADLPEINGFRWFLSPSGQCAILIRSTIPCRQINLSCNKCQKHKNDKILFG